MATTEPGGRPGGGGARSRGWWVLTVAVLVVATVAGVLVAVLVGTGSEQAGPGSTTTAPGTSTTAPAVPAATSRAVYPTVASGVRFSHPVAAARAFATDYVGFVDPVVGSFDAAGAAAGTVPVRATSSGAVTTVHLERLDGTWWVTGSTTPDIALDEPAALASIASPVTLHGTSTAFEAQVDVEVRQDDLRAPIGTGFVMGGANGQLGPFDGTVPFTPPTATAGALVLTTVSMESGHVWEAQVVRVRFAPVVTLTPETPCPRYAMARPAAPAGEQVVTVYFSCGVDTTPVPTYRLVPATTAVLRASLGQLLAGPTAPEQSAGLTSWFSAKTAGMLASVSLAGGSATVDFHDLRTVISGASSSAGSHLLLAQLDATVFHFSSVTSVTYRIDGSCETFSEWLQLGGCVTHTRATSAAG